ncbi:hypothetical protein [Pseudonocardia sp. KRD291]|uniref:hypothetical protein n=1 Tax=Pseudonocardia sp. KRD291 TaxID=2792007 RepID=UPI001C4A062E|nr:hypothetical protein [Pseudonocardia sp. KRD291]MBW0105277.1 hypothetical protein [Pseudonocardia sp. KRD291]
MSAAAAAVAPPADVAATSATDSVAADRSRVSWVLDPRDDTACVRALQDLQDLAAGRVVCHPRPGATWPALVEDLLRALGKDPQALTRERCTRHGPRLLRVWLRAEQVSDLVVLRAHRLPPVLLARLVDLAADCDVALWLVWHHHSTAPLPYPRIGWVGAVGTLLAALGIASSTLTEREVYIAAFAAARHEARIWRPDGHRLGWKLPTTQHAWPGCDVGALLQRLTVDAATGAELRTRLRAAQDGFAAEHRRLTLPELGPATVAALGPRLAPATVTRLRRLVCPVTAAAVALALATDAEPRFLAHHLVHAGAEQIALLAGLYRVPERARPPIRAAIGTHDDPAPGQPMFAPPGHLYLSAQRLAHRVARGATLAGISPPTAARPLYGIHPATPFGATVAQVASVTND